MWSWCLEGSSAQLWNTIYSPATLCTHTLSDQPAGHQGITEIHLSSYNGENKFLIKMIVTAPGLWSYSLRTCAVVIHVITDSEFALHKYFQYIKNVFLWIKDQNRRCKNKTWYFVDLDVIKTCLSEDYFFWANISIQPIKRNEQQAELSVVHLCGAS